MALNLKNKKPHAVEALADEKSGTSAGQNALLGAVLGANTAANVVANKNNGTGQGNNPLLANGIPAGNKVLYGNNNIGGNTVAVNKDEVDASRVPTTPVVQGNNPLLANGITQGVNTAVDTVIKNNQNNNSVAPSNPLADILANGITTGAEAAIDKVVENQQNSKPLSQNAYDVYNSYLEQVKNFGDFNYINDQQLQDVMSLINNREKFSYDFNADALYQQYKDKYIQQGKMAMADAMGQAAAMTGGYGNSYAQSVGQQAYQGQLQNLNDVIPELYQMALDKYKMEGNDLYNQYEMLVDDYNRAYGEYSDEYGRMLDSLGIARDDYFKALEMEREQKWRDEDIAYRDSLNKTEGTQNDTEDLGDAIPDSILERAATFEDNESLAEWAYSLEDSGVIAKGQATKLISQFLDPNEKFAETEDESGNVTSKYSFSDMVKSTSGWSVVNNGGANLFGVDNNAIVKAPNGEQIRLDNLVDYLVDEGMKRSEAKSYVKQLQKNLGI